MPRWLRAPAVLVVLAGACVASASTAEAQALYRWTDEAGQTHITDDPNQVPDSRRPKAPPPEPRSAARAAIDTLRSLAALVQDVPAHEDYAEGVAQAGRAVDRAAEGMERGGLRSALAAALGCYREAAELWGNQLAVRRGVNLALNMAPLHRAWECGAQKTAEAERLLAGRR